MKTGTKVAPSLPSMGMIVLISVIFIVPLLLWGNRWPWLGLIPFFLIVIVTVRVEIQRLRNVQCQWETRTHAQVVEVRFVPTVFDSRVVAYPFPEENEWACVVESEISERTGNRMTSVGYGTFRKASDERFAAIA